jgi:hypothetical protein
VFRDDRAGHDRNARQTLQDLVDNDPIPAEKQHLGHVYVVAQPLAGTDDVMVPLLTNPQLVPLVFHVVQQVEKDVGGSPTSPRLHEAIARRQRAEGVALTAGLETPEPYERGMLDLVIQENGTVSLICGRGTETYQQPNVFPPPAPQKVLYPGLVLQLTHEILLVAGRLADQHAGYQGQWSLGVRITGLAGAVAYEATRRFDPPRDRYNRETYEAVTTGSTADLVTEPHFIVERLLARLVRGLGVADQHLPYRPAARPA